MSTLNTYNLKSPDSANTNLALDASGNVAIQAGSASTPSVYVTGDANTGLYSPGADQVALTTGGTARLYIDSSGRVGIGSTTAEKILTVLKNGDSGLYIKSADTNHSNLQLGVDTANSYSFIQSGSAGSGSALNMAFFVGSTERARLDTSGRLLVGTSSSLSSALLQLRGNSDGASGFGYLQIQRGGNPATNEELGYIAFSDATSGTNGAHISAVRDGGTWSASSKPTRLAFSTTADGASSPTERMRITNAGSHLFNTTNDALRDATSGGGVVLGAGGRSEFARDSSTPVSINRTVNDGALIDFRQDATIEGTISVSGTTVSYNGAHLSRWSQLPSGAERTDILRGSVLSNIDEMCEWGEEGNEQLNRMKVSDVEGDKNVSGVFQAWDDDDDTYTNDFYCAMTGDFIIRIGAGVTVERGDLLMSAGDGTAKPQDDDIIRSKTIAKVTSTNVSCTYDDGSYCVPCVLMAC